MSRAPLGVVASGHPEVSAAAAAALRRGGNAFDAALAAGFAACVVEPMFTSLGGGGFLLAREADGRVRVFDFFVDTPGREAGEGAREPHFVPVTVRFPASEQVFNVGMGSVAVPGTLAGFLHVHERLAGLPLAALVGDASRLARHGVWLNPHQAYVQELLGPILRLSEGGRAIYGRDGRGLRAGERLVNPELADFLDALPWDGGDRLYRGDLAARVAADMRAGQGLLGADDLAAYRVRQHVPLETSYRGSRVLTNPPPSAGGPLLLEALRGLEARDVAAAGFGSAEHLCALAEVMQQVERLRAAPAAGGTTHISVADAAGNAASLSLSNGEGSGYVVPGTGVMLNNMLGEDDLHPGGFHSAPPGTRIASMMSPTLVLRGDRVRLVLGSGGSKRIRSALLQVMVAALDYGRPLEEAGGAPRIHWDGEALQVEPGLDAGALAALAERWPVNVWGERNLYFGGVHAIDPSGQAVGDPRREGHGTAVYPEDPAGKRS